MIDGVRFRKLREFTGKLFGVLWIKNKPVFWMKGFAQYDGSYSESTDRPPSELATFDWRRFLGIFDTVGEFSFG